MYNGSAYDNFLIVSYLLKSRFSASVEVIAKNTNNFITCSFSFLHQPNNVRIKVNFIDTYLHLHSSMKDVITSIEHTPRLDAFFQNLLPNIPIKRELINKIPMFYDLLNSHDILTQINSFPTKEQFKNSLTHEDISDESYYFSKLLWDKLNCKTYLDYVTVYAQIDAVIHGEVSYKYYQKFN